MSAEQIRLTVVHLEDLGEDRNRIRAHRLQIQEAFAQFLAEEFPGFPVDKLKVDLVAVGSPALLAEKMVRLTKIDDGGSALRVQIPNVALFLVDYYLDGADLTGHIDNLMMPEPHASLSVRQWLNAVFPVVPKVLLTSAASKHVGDNDGWGHLNKDIMADPSQIRKAVYGHLQKTWEPVFWKKLRGLANSADQSWHTPGHNHGSAFSRSPFQKDFYNAFGGAASDKAFAADLSVSVDELGDLSEPDLDSPLTQARLRATRLFGAEDSFFMTNGTSTSNKALLMALLRPGEAVLLDRNCHKSVHQAVVLAGAVPIYLPSAWNGQLGVWAPVPPEAIREYLDLTQHCGLSPRLVLLTSCTYEGVLYPLDAISRECEKRGVLLYADEAWAPHLRFHPYYQRSTGGTLIPYCATQAGAHFVVQSTHKMLAAFSQASMIHVTERFRQRLEATAGVWKWLGERFGRDYANFKHHLLEVLRYWHSTSPHYPMLATLERAGLQMGLEGMRLLEERLRWAGEIRAEAGPAWVDLTNIVGADNLPRFEGFLKDPLKIVLAFADEADGEVFLRSLKTNNIRWEKKTRGCVELLITVGTFYTDIDGLFRAMKSARASLRATVGEPAITSGLVTGQAAVLPRDAVAADTELVAIADAADRVAAQMLVPYPPGIPVVLPGLRISAGMIGLIEAAHRLDPKSVHGLMDLGGRPGVRVMRREAADREAAKFVTSRNALDQIDRLENELHQRWVRRDATPKAGTPA